MTGVEERSRLPADRDALYCTFLGCTYLGCTYLADGAMWVAVGILGFSFGGNGGVITSETCGCARR
jgi:hypothetical protein